MKEGISLAEFEKRADSCLTILDGIKLMRRRLKWECDRTDTVFVDAQSKEELSNIIMGLGNQYERAIQHLISQL